MTDSEKVQAIIHSTNQGTTLDKHHYLILQAALYGELGDATRVIFDDLWKQYSGGGKIISYGQSGADYPTALHKNMFYRY